MLLTTTHLTDRLHGNLISARRVDVAVAWASDCDALDALCRFAEKGGQLRAIVGIAGNATHPNALRALQRCAVLRIATRAAGGLFHPKLYLFHNEDHRLGWIGSANLSHSAFGLNDELVFEFEDHDAGASRWFDSLWDTLGDDASNAAIVDLYERNWIAPQPPPRAALLHDDPAADEAIYSYIQSGMEWPAYAAAILKADAYWGAFWSRHDPVTGEVDAWLQTIALGYAVLRRPSWDVLSREDRYLILGRATYGHLGSMRGAGHANNVFKEPSPANLNKRRRIRRALQPVIDAPDQAFVQEACRFIAELEAICGFGGALATRLLTLARPDRGISVNQGSRKRLAKLTGLPATSLAKSPQGRGKSYLDLLRWFEAQDWYVNPTPRDERERIFVRYRAALFDPFVYEATQ